MSIKEKFQNLASSSLNKLPSSANLFLRYYTGLGSKGLDLKDDYLSKVREEYNWTKCAPHKTFIYAVLLSETPPTAIKNNL